MKKKKKKKDILAFIGQVYQTVRLNGLTYLYEIFNLLINESGMGFVKVMYGR